jgi:hypothetical protein
MVAWDDAFADEVGAGASMMVAPRLAWTVEARDAAVAATGGFRRETAPQ